MSSSTDSQTPARLQEKNYLSKVKHCLEDNLAEIEQRLKFYADEIKAQKNYLWESRAEMDHIEKIASRQSIEQYTMVGENIAERHERLKKLQDSPYFGRFDFTVSGKQTPEKVYIGVHHFHDELAKKDIVFDWRAPVASLFYDFETGPASYQSPKGEIKGDITLKRQFRIKQGEMTLMIESAVNVVDDVLQETLSSASDDSMKNIVATIQRDQNAIIRNEEASTLIIQGVAGSGKTSIALHRIAFLLYRFRDTLTSEDILIISPNRVFADYISNVLPELGEETVNEVGMEDVANELLDGKYRFQTFFEQTAELLEKNDKLMRERLQFKARPELLQELNRYAAELEAKRFVAEDVWLAGRLMPGWLLEETYRKHRSLSTSERISQVVREAAQMIGIQYNYDLQPEDTKKLREAVKGMVRHFTLRQAYKDFYTWLEKPAMFQRAKNGKLEYADVFPLIYLKMQLEGIKSSYRNVKHLLIDEMQDYTPVQYAVISRLFKCRKTILGDARQSVNPYNSSTAEEIQKIFFASSRVTLNKSFRSSYEISHFSQRICYNPDLEIIKRHGEEPKIRQFKKRADEYAAIDNEAEAFATSGHNTLGIICKTQKQAQQIYKALEKNREDLQLLTTDSLSFNKGIIICTAHMAKGLEFDQVIVPMATEDNYHSEMDRHLLYVACTRAMHRLLLTATGDPSTFTQAKVK